MSQQPESKRNEQNRMRTHSVAFRMDDNEWQAFLERVDLSGHQRQDYLIKSAIYQEIVVVGNSALFKKLDSALGALVDELRRLDEIVTEDDFPVLRIKTLLEIIDSLRQGEHSDALDDFMKRSFVKS